MCDAGFYSNGTYSIPPNVTTECDPCPVGAWCDEGSVSYNLCSPGYFQNQTEQSTCNWCVGGYYQNSTGQVICDLCPAGGYCPDPNATYVNAQPLICPAGFYSQMGAVECVQCEAGYFQENDNSDNCDDPCDVGEYSDVGAVECNLCPANTYNDVLGSAQCTQCPPGLSLVSIYIDPYKCAVCVFILIIFLFFHVCYDVFRSSQ